MGKGSGSCDDRKSLSIGQTMSYLFDDGSPHSAGGAVLDMFMENEMEAYLEDELDRRDCTVRRLSIPPFTMSDFKRSNDSFIFEADEHRLEVQWSAEVERIGPRLIKNDNIILLNTTSSLMMVKFSKQFRLIRPPTHFYRG